MRTTRSWVQSESPGNRDLERDGSDGLGGFATATLLRDGTVLARSDGGSELFDPDTGTWTATRSRPAQRHDHDHVAILLPDGRVLVAGGHDDDSIYPTDSAELYDPATGPGRPPPTFDTPRYLLAATLLPDGTVLMVGRAELTTAQVVRTRERVVGRHGGTFPGRVRFTTR